jgi:hypothetical protein
MDQVLEQLLALAHYIAALFTTDEWKSLVVLVVATLCATQTGKIIWRRIPWTSGGASAAINLTAAIAGVALAYLVWPVMAHDNIPWVVPGLMAGPFSILAFKVLNWALQKYAPELARFINGDRRRPGDRRRTAGVAPGGAPERREEQRRKS